MGVLSRRSKESSPSSLDEEKESQIAGPTIAGDADQYNDSPYPLLTWRTIVMGILVSMGGLIFGYDTGQISGFLQMQDFLMRFGQLMPDPKNPGAMSYQFTNVRSGLIVGLVSGSHLQQEHR